MEGMLDIPTFTSLTYEGYRQYAELLSQRLVGDVPAQTLGEGARPFFQLNVDIGQLRLARFGVVRKDKRKLQ